MLGLRAQTFPTRRSRHSEHVDFAVVVAVFQFLGKHGGIDVWHVIFVIDVGEPGNQFIATDLEGVRDIFDEDRSISCT